MLLECFVWIALNPSQFIPLLYMYNLDLFMKISPPNPPKGVVIVTGAAGFIGRFVALHASMLGYDVYGIGHGSIHERNLIP